MQNRIGAYRQTDTLGKSQLDLILQVYDGAMKAYTTASEHYSKGEYQSGYEQLEDAKRFVTHLYTTLDFEKGGVIAHNLGKMYAYLLNETNAVQATKNIEQLEALARVLDTLRQAWVELRTTEVETRQPEPTPVASGSTGGFVTSG
jgi:flagellar protein FliS